MLKLRLVGVLCALTFLSLPAAVMAQTAALDAAPALDLEQALQPQAQQPQAQPQPAQAQAPPASARPTVAAEYSDAYVTRRKIHFYASFATAPLFVTQYIIGQKLYNGSGSDGLRGAHSAIGVGMGALFGIDSVTGVWNLWEARHDPNGRRRRLIHGITMLGADAGFFATGLTAPGHEGEREGGGGGDRSLHRTLAITSMGVAAGSYVYMLLTR